MASIAPFGKASEREGSTNTSDPPSSALTSSRCPRNSTRSSSRCVRTSASSSARRGPSPTMWNCTSGKSAASRRAAAISVSWLFSGRRLATVMTERTGRVRGVRATLRVAGGVDAVRNHRNRSGREPLRLENAPCRLRVRDDLRGTPIGQALQPDLARRLVGVELAAAADPHRHARQGGSRQAEDVRVEVACLHHRDPLAPAPAREGEQRANRCRSGETLDRKFDNRGRALRHPWQPRARLSKQATWTRNREGFSRRISSVICRSVPPGSNRVRKTATGICGDGFTVVNLSKAGATPSPAK